MAGLRADPGRPGQADEPGKPWLPRGSRRHRAARRARWPATRTGLRAWHGHRLFTAVLAIAVLLRVLAALAFRPALFTSDSFGYLISGVNPAPG